MNTIAETYENGHDFDQWWMKTEVQEAPMIRNLWIDKAKGHSAHYSEIDGEYTFIFNDGSVWNVGGVV